MRIEYDWQTGIHSVELRHAGLQKYRMIRGRDRYVVKEKARAQQAAWEKQWGTQCERKEQRRAKDAEHRRLESRALQAEKRTETARAELERLKNLLAYATTRNPAPDFDKLKNRERIQAAEFSKFKPDPPQATEGPRFRVVPIRPSEPEIPDKPSKDAPKYRPNFTLLDKLFQSRKEKAIAAANALYEADLASWERRKKKIENQYAAELIVWENKKAEVEKENLQRRITSEAKTEKANAAFANRLAAWEQEKEAFNLQQKAASALFKARQKKSNDDLKNIEDAYSVKTPKGIVEYCRLVLSQSDYPKEFPRKFELDYIPETKLLLVEYSLPLIDALPTVAEVSYLPSKDEFRETLLADTILKRLYDNVLYQVTLRSIHELFKADRAKAVGSIVFNGWVHGLNKATGKRVNTCVLSVHTKREAFLDLDLKKVDPKACFQLLKGIGSSELHGLAAVAPIMRIDKRDKRFVEGYGVTQELDGAVNLAAMDWEDFEHLVRELFEKEFAQYGGEVKVTQASRDGGVDAVAFDPDPIRGGKIVIQAKRYTNVVGLSAVRDLYGTVVNEGAIKGILVTTASYGPDAYEFVKDKPLTLLNGSNLLHMLERQGHKAKIDLREAKRLLVTKEQKVG